MVNSKPDLVSMLTIFFISAPSCGDKGIFTICATLEYIVHTYFTTRFHLLDFISSIEFFTLKSDICPSDFSLWKNHQPTRAQLLPGLEQYYAAL